MVTRLESLRAVSDLDATGYTQGAQQVEAANRRMERSQDDVTQAVSQTERRIQESTTAYDRFVRQLDPAAAAQARLAAQTERVNRWLEQGRITAEQHARAMQLLNQRYSTTATSAQRLATANDNASSSGRNMGQILGQAGFQIQDYAWQVAAGQSALVAFAQQGSQLLGIFGTAGAIAGAILTVGVLAAQLLGLGRSTKEAKNATDEYNEALRKSGEFLETNEERTRRLYEEKRKETQETLRSAAAIQLENIARAQAAEQRAADVLERLQTDPRRTPDGARFNQSAIDQAATVATVARQRADEAAAALGRLLDEYEKVSRAQPEAERGIRGVRDANADAARAERERIALANQLERDLQDAIDKENALVEARRKLVEEVDALVAAEQRRARETYERQLERSIGNAVDRGADIFYDVFTGRAQDFGQVLRQIVARAMAQAAAEVVLRPIVAPIVAAALGGAGGGGGAGAFGTASNVSTLTGLNPLSSIGGLSGVGTYINGVGYSSGLTGIGAMNTPMGYSPAASGALGSATATQLLGAAGVGFGSGYFLSSATGSRAVGTIGGAGVGAAYGFMVGGPAGAVIGGIAGGAGGLIGGMGQRGDPYTQGQIALVDGRLVGTAAGDNNADPSRLQSEIDQGISQIEGVRAARGLVYSRGAGLFGDRTDRTVKQAFDEIAAGLRPGSGTGAATAAVLDSGRVTGIDSLNALLGRADEFDGLSASLRATFDVTNQAEQQFAALSAQLDQAKVFADEFGLSLADVTAEMAGDFDEQIRRSILGITDANALALEDQDRTNAARLELARKIGADIARVEQLNGLERTAIVERATAEQRRIVEDAAREQARREAEAAASQASILQIIVDSFTSATNAMIAEAQRLRDEVDQALLGPYSNLSPEQRLALAGQRFNAGQLGLNDYLAEGAKAYGTATADYAGFFSGALDSSRGRAASLDAAAAQQSANLAIAIAAFRGAPGFATGGSFDVMGPAGNDNIYFAGARVTAGETVNVSTRDTMRELISITRELLSEMRRNTSVAIGAGEGTIGRLAAVERRLAEQNAIAERESAA